MKKRNKRLLPSSVGMRIVVAALIIGLFPASFAAAQEEKVREKEHKLGKMTVTAQKQEENVQEVPVSATVLNSVDIEDRSIESISEVADFVPNFMIFYNGNAGMNSPSMRGIHAPIESASVSAGLYIDDVPVLSPIGFEDMMLDIERVEVLRGPQGTLYGKNTETGAINIVTRQPDNEFRARLSLTGGRLLSTEAGDGLTYSAAINLSGPIKKDKLFLGLAAKYDARDGFVENTLTGEPLDDRQHWFGRFNLRWTPTQRLDVSLASTMLQYHDDASTTNLTEYAAMLYGLSAPEDRKASSNLPGENRAHGDTQSLKIEYRFNDSLALTSITSRRYFNDDALDDYDFTSYTMMHSDKDCEYENISQELRLNYSQDRLKWLGGVYLDRNDNDIFQESISDYPSIEGVNSREITGNTYAAFAHLTYPLIDRLSLVAGLRYEQSEKDLNVHTDNKQTSDDWDAITSKIALEYGITNEVMVYASASQGYRSGGFNPMATDPRYYSYDEEKLWSYEIGAKSAFFDNRLVVNGGVYLMKIDDMQVYEAISPGESYLTNAAEATGKGIELELTARVWDGLTLMAGFGYSDIEFDEFKDALGDYQGNKNPYAPEYTYNLGAQYRFASGFYARADLVGYGKMYFDRANQYSRDAFEIVNARVGYEMKHFDIYLYGKNIFDKAYDSYGYYDGYYTIYSDPGEVGLQLTYRF